MVALVKSKTSILLCKILVKSTRSIRWSLWGDLYSLQEMHLLSTNDSSILGLFKPNRLCYRMSETGGLELIWSTNIAKELYPQRAGWHAPKLQSTVTFLLSKILLISDLERRKTDNVTSSWLKVSLVKAAKQRVTGYLRTLRYRRLHLKGTTTSMESGSWMKRAKIWWLI